MQAEDDLGRRILQHPLLDHQPRSALLTGRRAFLGGLEDELDRARQFAAYFGEYLSGGHQYGRVGVVTAGVHHARLLAAPVGAHLGGERQVDLLGYRQRIHVGAQRDDGTRLAPLEHGDNAGVAHLLAHVVAELLQVLGDQGGRCGIRGSPARDSGGCRGARR